MRYGFFLTVNRPERRACTLYLTVRGRSLDWGLCSTSNAVHYRDKITCIAALHDSRQKKKNNNLSHGRRIYYYSSTRITVISYTPADRELEFTFYCTVHCTAQ